MLLTVDIVFIGTRTIDIPLLKVLVGNPSLLEVKLESYFDDTDSYSIEVFVDSKSLRQVRFSFNYKNVC
jgi:hypothetical protein